LIIILAISIQSLAEAEVTNNFASMGTQAAPLTLMINGPTGRGTVPIEFWVDKISIGDANKQLEREVGIYRLPQGGYTMSEPSIYAGDFNRLLQATNSFWWVPEIGLVSACADTFLTLGLYTTKTGSRAGARIVIEDRARKQEKPVKGVLGWDLQSIDLRDAFDRDFFYSPNSIPSRSFNITKLVYTKQTWVIDMERMDGKTAAQLVLDSNFKLKKAKRIK